jgi:K+-transporting ATPase KdpF subunit
MRASHRASKRAMNWGYLIIGIVAFGLLVYLFYALIRPEKF